MALIYTLIYKTNQLLTIFSKFYKLFESANKDRIKFGAGVMICVHMSVHWNVSQKGRAAP